MACKCGERADIQWEENQGVKCGSPCLACLRDRPQAVMS